MRGMNLELIYCHFFWIKLIFSCNIIYMVAFCVLQRYFKWSGEVLSALMTLYLLSFGCILIYKLSACIFQVGKKKLLHRYAFST